MHRFFVPPEWIHDGEAHIAGPQAGQINRVLRAKRGYQVVLLDNSGWEYQAEISRVSGDSVTARILDRTAATPEPRIAISLYQGVLKGKKLDFVFQKGTEIGVSTFIPLLCTRCVALPAAGDEKQRWATIIRESAEQCGRGQLPQIVAAESFNNACQQAPDVSFLLSGRPGAPGVRTSLRQALEANPERIGIFVGPEGGFEPDEVSCAENHGIRPVSLGRRILRGETAGLVAAAIILYEAGEIG